MPWVSKQTILRVRRVAQLHSDGGELKNEALAVSQFIAERANPQESKPWEKLCAEWNKQHPDQRFSNRSSIASAYKRAEKKLAGPWSDVLKDRAEDNADLA